MNTTYKTRTPSPFPVRRMHMPTAKPHTEDVPRSAMQNLLGTYQFNATFEEDTQTAKTFEAIPNLIAFICTLRKDGEVIGQGRGTAVINQVNRFVMRTINFAHNAALVDAVVRATKLQDIFRPDNAPHPWGDIAEIDDKATTKQVEYLRQLIQTGIDDDEERDRVGASLETLTKSEASQMIESFRR
jgi:hypothetical protein